MPINITYNPSYATSGAISNAAGRGEFLQKEDKFNFEQDKFSQSLAENQRQYDQSLALNVGKTQLQNRQFNQSLNQRGNQFDRTLDQRGYLAERGFENEASRENRLWDQGDRGLDLQEDAMKQRAALDKRREFAGVKAAEDKRTFAMGNQEWNRLQEWRATAKPEEYDQAAQQWLDKYGGSAGFDGQLPSDIPAEPGSPDFSLDMMKGRLTAAGLPEEDVWMYGESDLEGNFTLYEGANERIEIRAEKERDRVHDLEKHRITQEAAASVRRDTAQATADKAADAKVEAHTKARQAARQKLLDKMDDPVKVPAVAGTKEKEGFDARKASERPPTDADRRMRHAAMKESMRRWDQNHAPPRVADESGWSGFPFAPPANQPEEAWGGVPFAPPSEEPVGWGGVPSFPSSPRAPQEAQAPPEEEDTSGWIGGVNNPAGIDDNSRDYMTHPIRDNDDMGEAKRMLRHLPINDETKKIMSSAPVGAMFYVDGQLVRKQENGRFALVQTVGRN